MAEPLSDYELDAERTPLRRAIEDGAYGDLAERLLATIDARDARIARADKQSEVLLGALRRLRDVVTTAAGVYLIDALLPSDDDAPAEGQT